MSTRDVVREPVPESSTPAMRFRIVDGDGVGFKPETLRVTLWNYLDRAIINNRYRVDIFDVNGGTIDVNGLVQWAMTREDTAIINSDETVMLDTSRILPTSALQALGLETHIALFEWTWLSGEQNSSHEIEHRVQNTVKIATVLTGSPVLAGVGSFGAVGAAV